MSYSVDAVERAARLVRTWGASRLRDGRTLSDALTVNGLPLWSAASPNLAAYYLPPALARTSRVAQWAARARTQASRASRRWRHRAPTLETHGCERWPAAPAALLLGFSAYMYRDVLAPVAAALTMPAVAVFDPTLEAGGTSVAVGTAADALGRESIWRHWDARVADAAAAEQAAYTRAIASLDYARTLPAIVRDGDQDLWPVARPLFEWLFFVYFPALLPHIAVARHLLDQHRPAIVVSADVDDKHNRLYVELARQRGIPSLEVQFGTYGAGNVEWQFFEADQLAVWGEQARDFMLTQGVPGGRIRITGSPRNDAAVRAAAAPSRAALDRLGVPATQRTVLYACVFSGLVDASRLASLDAAILAAAAADPGLTLVVKPHPGDPPGAADRFRGQPGVVIADRGADIRELIWCCDAFLSLGSTSTMDALVAGKPVIWPDLFDVAWWDDEFKASGATLVVKTTDALAAAFRETAAGHIAAACVPLSAARDAFLTRMVYRVDGRAAERIAALAAELIATPPGSAGAPVESAR